MKRLLGLVILLLFAGVSMAGTHTLANESHPGGPHSGRYSLHQQQCYAMAMIGLDTVINARLGVLPEHIVELNKVTENQHEELVLNVMLAAYLWEDSPHNYAVQVFYDCARNS
jgi:hypothetical protein